MSLANILVVGKTLRSKHTSAACERTIQYTTPYHHAACSTRDYIVYHTISPCCLLYQKYTTPYHHAACSTRGLYSIPYHFVPNHAGNSSTLTHVTMVTKPHFQLSTASVTYSTFKILHKFLLQTTNPAEAWDQGQTHGIEMAERKQLLLEMTYLHSLW